MRQLMLVVGGVVAGVVAVLAVAALVLGDDEDAAPTEGIELSFPAIEHDDEAAEALVVAWHRWRTATFVTIGTWTRTLDGDEDPLTGDSFLAQDPPRRVVVRLGAVIESIDGSTVTCDDPTEPVIVPGCTEVAGGSSYGERLRTEMSLVLNYARGDDRLYDVATADGCFQVALREAALRSPWGRAAEFCFDDETGALASSRVRRQSAIDTEITSVIRTEVTDDDFGLTE
ncbi:MAG: hypothetical protein RIB98_11400 [Acidimicrobiales bacterium]